MSARAWRHWAEALALAVSPAAAYFVLRIRLMPIADLNDPAMHTTYMIDPQSIFLRYSAAFESSQRLREGARVGLLLPGRISYLLFGGLPGFVVFRYVLALVAVVPTYLLLRRLFGRAAGAVGVIVIISSPVILTAWGTDFPNSATISYLIAGLACLAMPSAHRRVLWLAGSAAFFTVAVWTFASSTVLIVATVAAYAVIRWRRDRENVLRDIEIVGGVAIAVTAVLAVGSFVLLGQFDFILPTFKSVIYLAHRSNVVLNHSAGPAWAPYLSYLLVLPAVVALWFVAFGRRLEPIPTPQLIVGAACTCQLVLAVLLQFLGGVQILEEHYFSSLLWAGVSVTLAMALVQLGRPMLDRRRFAWAVPVLLVAVPLAYEIDPHVPPSGWVPFGLGMLAIIAVIAAAADRLRRATPGLATLLATCASLALIDGCLLILTTAPVPGHVKPPNTVASPVPQYATALGGSDALAVNLYVVTTKLPGFVGPATYSGEQLLMWWPPAYQQELLGPIGIYHAFYDSLLGDFGTLSAAQRDMIEQRQPAQILLMSFTEDDFEQSFDALSAFEPRLVRAGVLRSGPVALHVWLIDLGHYFRGTS